ncbi:hypothetical protein VTK73DRAFT_3399 [Phialemonium thermophilum]|uniref:Uncharacterized protein n=1 Tax=Phialemonium thermophilum TaxID=223376 RepID=A0ABR3VIJ5_9PEZI
MQPALFVFHTYHELFKRLRLSSAPHALSLPVAVHGGACLSIYRRAEFDAEPMRLTIRILV